MKNSITNSVKLNNLENELIEANSKKDKIETELTEIINLKLSKTEGASNVINKKYFEISEELDKVNETLKSLQNEEIANYKNYQRLQKIDELVSINKKAIDYLDSITLHLLIISLHYL